MFIYTVNGHVPLTQRGHKKMTPTETDVQQALKSNEPSVIMVYSDACEKMVSVWDKFDNKSPARMYKVHADDIPNMCLYYGIHFLPSYISNRGKTVQIGYRNTKDLNMMVSSIANFSH